ncbi:hypothetical protein LCGC14_1829540, partial [marine sediment metagenome]
MKGIYYRDDTFFSETNRFFPKIPNRSHFPSEQNRKIVMTLTNRKLPARDNSGRFCNSGAYRVAHACHPTAFTPVS